MPGAQPGGQGTREIRIEEHKPQRESPHRVDAAGHPEPHGKQADGNQQERINQQWRAVERPSGSTTEKAF